MTYPERICVVLGCGRAVRRSATGSGWVYNRCPNHVSALQAGAFGPTDPTPRAEPLPDPPAAQLKAPDRVMTRDGPRAGRVPRFDLSTHRGRPDHIPVRPGA